MLRVRLPPPSGLYGHVAELVHATVCKTVFNVGSNPIVVLLHSAIVELVQHLVLVQDSFLRLSGGSNPPGRNPT